MRRLALMLCLALGLAGCASQPPSKLTLPAAPPIQGRPLSVAPPVTDASANTRALTEALVAGHERAQVYLRERTPSFRHEAIALDNTLARPKALSVTQRQAAIQGVTGQWSAWLTTEAATSVQVSAVMNATHKEVVRCAHEAKTNGGQLSTDCQSMKMALNTWGQDLERVRAAMIENYLWWVVARGKADAADPSLVVLVKMTDITPKDGATQYRFPDFRSPPLGAAL